MDHIVALELDGIRGFSNFRLDLSPLTVLIGENGVGKSTLLEVAADLGLPLATKYDVRVAMQRWGCRTTAQIAVEITDGVGPRLRYELRATCDSEGDCAVQETLQEGDHVHFTGARRPGATTLQLWARADAAPAVCRVRDALLGIRGGARASLPVILPAAQAACREAVGLGFQRPIDGIEVACAGQLGVRVAGRTLWEDQLSSGERAWLSWCLRLINPIPGSLGVLDDPELHLHPGMIPYLADLLARRSRTRPLLVATHSDALLDALADPADAIRVLERDAGGVTVRGLDPARVAKWTGERGGVGALRAAGLLFEVYAECAV